MQAHSFVVGQTVRFRPGAFESAALRGTYRIVRLPPPDANANQYRIKSTVDGHERVVRESQLSRD